MIDQTTLLVGISSIAAGAMLAASALTFSVHRWRRIARTASAQCDHALDKVKAEQCRSKEWRETAERLARHNFELTEQLRGINRADEPVTTPTPSWHRPRDAKGHFIKAGAAIAG